MPAPKSSPRAALFYLAPVPGELASISESRESTLPKDGEKETARHFLKQFRGGSNRIFCPLLLNKKKRKGKVERKTTKKKACRVDNETSSANGGDSSMIHRARGSECRSLFWHRPARARRRSATKRRGARESLEQRHGFVAGKSPRATVYNRGVGVR